MYYVSHFQECQSTVDLYENKRWVPSPGIEPGPQEWESYILTVRQRGTWWCLSKVPYINCIGLGSHFELRVFIAIQYVRVLLVTVCLMLISLVFAFLKASVLEHTLVVTVSAFPSRTTLAFTFRKVQWSPLSRTLTFSQILLHDKAAVHNNTLPFVCLSDSVSFAQPIFKKDGYGCAK